MTDHAEDVQLLASFVDNQRALPHIREAFARILARLEAAERTKEEDHARICHALRFASPVSVGEIVREVAALQAKATAFDRIRKALQSPTYERAPNALIDEVSGAVADAINAPVVNEAAPSMAQIAEAIRSGTFMSKLAKPPAAPPEHAPCKRCGGDGWHSVDGADYRCALCNPERAVPGSTKP